MAFMKFSKSKPIYSVPNGIGDGSAYFDGSTSAKLICQDLPTGSNPTSISAWFYQTSGTDLRTICGYGENSSSQQKFVMTRYPYVLSHVWGYDYAFESKAIGYKKWYHVVIVYENAIEKCYVNGELIGQREHSFNTNTSNFEFRIGTHNDDRYFIGNIKDINVYNRALSADEVTQLYNKQEITSGRVLYVPLQYGKDDETMFTSKNFVYDYTLPTNSSGFDEFGYPIEYDIASEARITKVNVPTEDIILYMSLKKLQAGPEIVDSDVFTISYEGTQTTESYQTVDDVPCIYLPSSTSIGLTTRGKREVRQATLSYWGKTTSGQCCITSSNSGYGNGSPEIWLGFASDHAYFGNGDGTETLIWVGMPISEAWHHIAATWDMDTNIMHLYLDGELIGTREDSTWKSPNFNANDYFHFNLNNLYRASGHGTGNSYYANVKMYKRVLSDKEIQALAREDITKEAPEVQIDANIPRDGLLCYLPFSTDYKDKITGINLQAEGTITLADNCVSNVYGSYLHGSNNMFTLPNTFTLSAYAYLENNGCEANRTIVDFGSYSNSQGFGIWTDSSNILKYRVNQNFANICEFEYQKWFMVTMTYDGQKVVFYIDGVESGSLDLQTTVNHGNEVFFFKRPYAEDSIVGKISDVLLYNRVLTLEEIQSLVK